MSDFTEHQELIINAFKKNPDLTMKRLGAKFGHNEGYVTGPISKYLKSIRTKSQYAFKETNNSC